MAILWMLGPGAEGSAFAVQCPTFDVRVSQFQWCLELGALNNSRPKFRRRVFHSMRFRHRLVTHFPMHHVDAA